ncbi:hypothetical protein M441DRAFT_375352 [Trichoderma asperellum CBS 433.97]|uniref:Uncharacterized protein n=1 Tax=Trichoderma asperellum (strain ATCC 204424 / CBS 433.97 / NBRC 101777) TaxID=1042311 RepID=A0A2T3ZFJ7_TRIA4|nr:hypothetical protein M441DRAFT_375352 [Trichoderma asperellum CBS 433.97]PTB43581.1 hypothetical protein M441DRAFT_375352 [Trichoderma asperellum CBS 433.97]
MYPFASIPSSIYSLARRKGCRFDMQKATSVRTYLDIVPALAYYSGVQISLRRRHRPRRLRRYPAASKDFLAAGRKWNSSLTQRQRKLRLFIRIDITFPPLPLLFSFFSISIPHLDPQQHASII